MISNAIQSNKKTSVIPFITCGYPNVENFVDLLLSLEKSGSSTFKFLSAILSLVVATIKYMAEAFNFPSYQSSF